MVSLTSCFVLNGSLTIDQNDLVDVSAEGYHLTDTVLMKQNDEYRIKATALGYYEFFIKALCDLNSHIDYLGNETGNTKDDAYAFRTVTVSSTDVPNPFVEMNLPVISDFHVNAGMIEADNDTLIGAARNLGSFPIRLTFGLSSQGILSASINVQPAVDVNGNVITTITGYLADSSLLAQVAYWDINSYVPSAHKPTPTQQDTLSKILISSELESQFRGALDAVVELYSGSVIVSSWTMTLDNLATSNNNALAQYARDHSNPSSVGSTNVFDAGELVMAATPFSYAVTIKDYQDNVKTICAAQNVYALFQQTA